LYKKKVLILNSIFNVYSRGRAGQKIGKIGKMCSKLSTTEARKKFTGAYKTKSVYNTTIKTMMYIIVYK